MKTSEFRKLIREEVRRVLKEAAPGTLRNVKANVFIFSGKETDQSQLMDKFFGKFITVKQAPNEEGDAVVDLNVAELLNLLQKNAKYSSEKARYSKKPGSVSIYFGGNDAIELYGLPTDTADVILSSNASRQASQAYSVTVHVGADPYANFDDFEDYSVPDVAKRVIGMPKITAEPETSAEERQIDQYVRKMEKALLAAAKKVVPGIKSMATEEGGFVFELPGAPDAQTKSKLKALFKGARKVTFK